MSNQPSRPGIARRRNFARPAVAREVIQTAAILFSVGLMACGKTSLTEAEYIERAESHMAAGEYQAGIIEYRNALKRNPENPAPRLALARVYLRLEDGVAAEEQLRWLLKGETREDQAASLLGQALLLQGKFEDVLAEVRVRGELSDSEKADLVALRAAAHMGLRQVSEAREATEKAARLAPDSLLVLLARIRLAAADRDLVAAQSFLTTALERYGPETRLWVLQGHLRNSVSDSEGAREAFARATELAPDGVPTASVQEAYVELVATQLRQGDLDGARLRADEFYRRAARSPAANYVKALIAYRLQDFREAHRFLVVAHKESPDYLPATLLLGATNYALGNYNQAETHLARYLRARPQDVRARVLLGAAQLRTQGPEEALDSYRSAASLATDDQALLALIGTAVIEAGDFQSGVEYLRRAVASDPDSVSARRQLAAAYLSYGAYDDAIRELESLKEKEQSPAPALMMAIAYARKGDLAKAEQICDELAAQNPADLDVRYVLGAVQIANDDTAAARETFEQMLELEPGSVRARVRLAQLDFQAGRVDDARRQLSNGLELNSRNVQLMLAMAQLEASQKDESRAVSWLERARAADREAIRPRALLVKYYLGKGQPREALAIAEEAVSANQDNSLALGMLAESQVATGETLAAVQTLERLVAQSPNSPDAHIRLGRAQVQVNDLEGAVVSLEKALDLRPGYWPAQIALGHVLIRRGDLDAALGLAKELTVNQPTDPAGFALEGEVRIIQKDYSAAVNSFAKAWVRDRSPRVTVRYAESLRLSGNTQRALTILRDWLQEHGDNIPVRLLLAELYHTTDRIGSAQREYIAILQAQPDNVIALNNLASLYHGRDDQQALAYATKAHRLRPDLGPVTDTLGWLLVDRGIDLNRGRELLRQAARQSPGVPEIRYHLALALSRSGLREEARSILVDALESEGAFPSREEATALLKDLK